MGILVYIGDAVIASLYLSAFGIAWMFGHYSTRIRRINQWSTMEQLSLAILCVGLAVAFQIFVQWLQIEAYFQGWVLDGAPKGRMRANVGQPNQAATTVLMATVSAGILFSRGHICGWVFWSSAVILTWAMVLTQSRTALLASLVITALLISILSQRLRFIECYVAIKRRQVLLWFALVLGMTWTFQTLTLPSISGGAGLDQLAQPGTRITIWTQMILAILENPWYGYGWLQLPSAQQVGALVLPGTEQTNYSHNIFIDLFVMLGVPSGLLILGTLLYFFARRLNFIRKSTEAIYALFLGVPFLVHSNLEFPHAYAYFIVLAGLLAGVVDAETKQLSINKNSSARKALGIFCVSFGIVLALVGYEYILVEEDFRINRFENRRLGTTPVGYTPPHLHLLDQMGEMLTGMRLRAQPNMSEADLNVLVRTSNRYSWAPLQFRTVLALALNGRTVEAEQHLRIIKGLFSAEVYGEARDTLIRLRVEKYPELAGLIIP